MRCWIVACLVFLCAELWSSGQHFSIRSAMQETPRLIELLCGVVLFVSSLVCFAWDRKLAGWGLAVGILTISVPLLAPNMAYN